MGSNRKRPFGYKMEFGEIVLHPAEAETVRWIYDSYLAGASYNALVDKLEKKAHLKGQKVTKYKYIGLWLFVAIPLPGTGAWTGSLAAAFLGMRLRKALPAVVMGVLTAGCIMLALTHVGINLFSGTM